MSDPIQIEELKGTIEAIEKAIQERAKEIGELAVILGRKYGELSKVLAEEKHVAS